MAGGTSAAAPIAAGIFTLLNGERLARGQPPMGFLNPWLCVHATCDRPPGFLGPRCTLHAVMLHTLAACTHRQVARCTVAATVIAALHHSGLVLQRTKMYTIQVLDRRAAPGDPEGCTRRRQLGRQPAAPNVCIAAMHSAVILSLVLSRAKSVPIRRSSERRL
jgi:hypothetical protein